LLLTNCTFDGIVYNVERLMLECLAIKPDLVFLWDEAWFAFARFHPSTASAPAWRAAAKLTEMFQSEAYAERYAEFASSFDEAAWADDEKCSIPACCPTRQGKGARLRHAVDPQDADRAAPGIDDPRLGSGLQGQGREAFHEAYMTHTSTSPNYQILATLDVGRRQVELEGYELVQRQLELAMNLRDQVKAHPLLKRYFHFLTVADLVPEEFRESHVESLYNVDTGWVNLLKAWHTDEFALDPSRATLSIGLSGMDGDTIKNKYLMDKYDIQINKTSRNTVLFMTNIGTTRSTIAYLIEVLVKIARDMDQGGRHEHPRTSHPRKARALAHRRVTAAAQLFVFPHQHSAAAA
jgi:arginine decarboxylase